MRALAASILLLCATPCLAKDLPTFFGVGIYTRITGYPGGDPTATGLGLEVSVHAYPKAWGPPLGIGAFAQIEAAGLGDEPQRRGRATAGGQIGYVLTTSSIPVALGGELGLCYETSDATHAASLGAHVAPYVSIAGVLTISIPVTLAIGSFGDGGSRQLGLGVAFAVKLPIPTEAFKGH